MQENMQNQTRSMFSTFPFTAQVPTDKKGG
jgi:hypothetical protein